MGRKIKTTGFLVDHNQFINVTTKEAAYFLGFFWADGSFNQLNGLRIEVKASDGEALLPIFTKLGQWGVYTRQRTNNGENFGTLMMQIITSNRMLLDYLESMDYKQKSFKAPIKILNTIPKFLQPYFWLGYLDGDGCIYIPKNNNKRWGARVNFWGTIDQDWSSLKSLCTELNIKYGIFKYQRRSNNGKIHESSTLIISRKDSLEQFLDYLYSNNDIGLNRKKEKYLLIKSYYDGQREQLTSSP